MNTCASNTHQLGALITAVGQRWVVGEKLCVILFMGVELEMRALHQSDF